MQECPFCGRQNRIVMKGVYKEGEKVELCPDMGYSFCNCKDIFYTREENLTEQVIPEPDENGVLTYPDPFFAWPDPYQFHYWNVRKYKILWDKDGLCEELKNKGYEIVSATRDFDPNSKTPQHFHIKVKKCQE